MNNLSLTKNIIIMKGGINLLFLDTKLETSEERLAFVNKYLEEENPTPNEKELEWLAD